MSASRQDQKLSRLIDEFGIHGYGAYWAVLEEIAAQMSSTNLAPHCTLSFKKWQQICQYSPKKLRKFGEIATKVGLFSVNFSDKSDKYVKIDCPKLLKINDEYTKKSRQSPDNVPTMSRQSPDKLPPRREEKRREEKRREEKERGEKDSQPKKSKKKNPTAPPKHWLDNFPDSFPDELWNWAVENKLAADPGQIKKETEKMIDHFNGQRERKKDWNAVWRNWMRRAEEFRTQRN